MLCKFCKRNDVNKKISVYCNRIGDACYWVVGNYAKHLKAKHKVDRQSRPILTGYSLTENNVKLESDSKMDTNSTSGDSSLYTEIDMYTSSTIADEKDGFCINLSIESVDGSIRSGFNCEENLEELMYTQISAQITKMLQSVLIHNEHEVTVIFDLDQSERVLQVTKINGDGNCLFRALAHQLFCEKLNTAAQNKSTKKLRADVVQYINENFEQFAHELKGCVFDSKTKNDIHVIEDECQIFVDSILSKDGSWGGSETIKAVSFMYSVNILLFNEYGPCYYANGFNSEYIRTVAIAYRLGSDSKLVRNHYDSVTRINQ